MVAPQKQRAGQAPRHVSPEISRKTTRRVLSTDRNMRGLWDLASGLRLAGGQRAPTKGYVKQLLERAGGRRQPLKMAARAGGLQVKRAGGS